MGRPLNKRYFADKLVGPTLAGNEIQIHFHNGTTTVNGFIVKQTGTRKFVVSETGVEDATYNCVLTAGLETHELTVGQMLIIVKADDGEVYTISKIAGHKCTLKTANVIGANIYDGKSVPWNFAADETDGAVQIEEAGDDNVGGNGDQDNLYEVAAEAPGKIADVALTVLGTSSIEINFTPPDPNGSVIIGYEVFVNGVLVSTFDVGEGLPLIQTGLTADTEYAIQVRATNGWPGPLSDAVTATTNGQAIT